MPDRSATAAPTSCKDHPATPALARCASCRRRLCDECFRFRLGGRPACARCAYEASTRPQRRVSIAAAFLCFAWGGCFWLVRRHGVWDKAPILLVCCAVAAAVIAYLIGASAKNAAAKEALEHREPGEEAPIEGAFEGGGSPYRAYARRAILAVSPRLSGKMTALVVAASLAAAAVLLPMAIRLPRWIEAEIVLGAWWLIVAATLVALLYRGFRLRDDLVYFLPWDRPAASEGSPAPKSKPGLGDHLSGADLSGCGNGCSGLDGEGCVGALAVALALTVALGAAWIFVELALPIAFVLTYWLFMRAIGRVANDRHGCEGDVMRSLGWGALWATIYVAPLAGLTWAAHAIGR